MSETPYNFGLSQEDERTEHAALELGPNDVVLSVASAGEMPLSLLALGAKEVWAVDVSAHQLHLVRLKLAAATRLGRGEAIRLIGYMPDSARARREALEAVSPDLPEDARRFWRERPKIVERGAVWAGRYERYVGLMLKVLRPIFTRKMIDGLFSCSSLDEQREYFQRTFDRPKVRALFELAFHPRLYARRGMDPRALAHRARDARPLGEQFFGHFRAACTETPVAGNHLLQLHLLGRVISEDAVPAFLSRDHVDRLRTRREQLHLVESDLVANARALPEGRINKLHLSNVTDWMPEDAFGELLRAIVKNAARPGRLVWRFMHADRPVPADLEGRLIADRALGERLRRTDRFPFYAIVPAEIPADVPAEVPAEVPGHTRAETSS